jgi:uncharacterized protein YndB with AHSA1/START domain
MSAEQSELTISRFIKAPPSTVWKAWSTPEHLEKWWIPAPMECKVVKLDLRAGGGFETRMREDGGAFQPHVEGCFVEIVPEARLVFTTVLTEGWKPAEPWLALTAIITFDAEASGTRYSARVLHKNAEDSRKHEEMGFNDGWGTTIAQLASFVERPA